MEKIVLIALMVSFIAGACTNASSQEDMYPISRSGSEESVALEKSTFAGGCFWCMEPPFEKLEGVKEVISGYTGGQTVNPTYEEVSAGGTGHLESVEIIYDPSKVSYEKLLDVFWRQINP